MNNPLEKPTRYLKLLRKYNTLETKYEVLKNDVKEECFKEIISKVGEPIELNRLREENKRLRLKNKELKEMLK